MGPFPIIDSICKTKEKKKQGLSLRKILVYFLAILGLGAILSTVIMEFLSPGFAERNRQLHRLFVGGGLAMLVAAWLISLTLPRR